MKILGLEINLTKSIISPKGRGVEFAKRFFLEGSDYSPVPFKEQSAAHRNVAAFSSFMNKYGMSLLAGLRFLGYGYKVDPTKLGTRAVGVLHLTTLIPQTYRELIKLYQMSPIKLVQKGKTTSSFNSQVLSFLQNPFDDPIENGSDPNYWQKGERLELLIKLTSTMVDQMFRKSKADYYEAIHQLVCLQVPAYTDDEESRLVRLFQVETLAKQYISDLEVIYLKMKRSRAELGDLPILIRKRIGGGQHRIAKYFTYSNMYHVNDHLPKLIMETLSTLFECQEIYDRVQIKDLFDPKMSGPSPDPVFLEKRNVLTHWNRWSSILSRMNIDIKDLIGNQPNT